MIDCRRCGEPREDNDFPRSHGKRQGLVCNVCKTIVARAWHAAHKGDAGYVTRRREARLKMEYGMTLADEAKMIADQGKKCAICRGWIYKGKWHIDHCHVTGKVRGILCGNCNRGLGYFQERTCVLAYAIKYIEKHSATIP